MANLALIFTSRSWSRVILSSSLKDPTLWTVTLGALAFSGVVIYVPPVSKLFRFTELGPLDLALCFGAGVLSITWFELLKWAGGRGDRSPARHDDAGTLATHGGRS